MVMEVAPRFQPINIKKQTFRLYQPHYPGYILRVGQCHLFLEVPFQLRELLESILSPKGG